MEKATSIQQPLLGVLATSICVAVSLGICALFDPGTFGTWVTLILVAMVPGQIILGLVWQNGYPTGIAALPQPLKGIGLLGCMFAAGALSAILSLYLVGGGITPPAPHLLHYIIFSVIVTFWLVIPMQCWPFSALSDHPLVIGAGTWLLSYVIAWGLFQVFFSYGFLAGTPVFYPELDPQGLFNGWFSLSFAVTTLMVMMALVLLDMWPLDKLAAKFAAFQSQPLFGLTVTLLVLLLAGIIWWYFVQLQGMDPVVYMVKVPVSVIFGEFIVLVMLQTAPVQTVAQPLKGLLLVLLAIVLSILMYALYALCAEWLFGPMAAGAPQYTLDLWLASAMLAVTFPMFVFYAEFLGYWPLRQDSGEVDES